MRPCHTHGIVLRTASLAAAPPVADTDVVTEPGDVAEPHQHQWVLHNAAFCGYTVYGGTRNTERRRPRALEHSTQQVARIFFERERARARARMSESEREREREREKERERHREREREKIAQAQVY